MPRWRRGNDAAAGWVPRTAPVDWAVASLPCSEDTTSPGWSRWLLVRRSLTRNAKGELELVYYLCCAAGFGEEGDLP